MKRWRGYGETSVGYQSQIEKYEMGTQITDVRYIDVTVVLKLRGLNIDNFFYTQLTLNEDGNNVYEQLNDISHKITVRKLHDGSFGKTVILLFLIF